jgi:hypothetical protein
VGAGEAVVAGARGQLSRLRKAVMSHRLPVSSSLMCVSRGLVAGRPGGQSASRPVARTVADPVVWALVTSSGDLALDSDAQSECRRGKLVARFVQTARMSVLR